jgi:hypothetical protein
VMRMHETYYEKASRGTFDADLLEYVTRAQTAVTSEHGLLKPGKEVFQVVRFLAT